MKICDKCGQQIDRPSYQPAGCRICAECGKRIKKHDKWFIGFDGRLHHRDCKNPTGKIKSDQSKGLFQG